MAGRVERRGVRDRVDPPRHAAHDHRPLRHGARQDAGRFRAIRRVVAASHEGDARLGEERQVPPNVEHRGRLRDLLELRREFRLAADQRAGAHREELRQDARSVVQTRVLDRRRRGAPDAFEGLELRLRCESASVARTSLSSIGLPTAPEYPGGPRLKCSPPVRPPRCVTTGVWCLVSDRLS